MHAFNDAIVTVPARPGLSANALRVLEARYLRRDGQRRVIETPEQLFARVAKAVAEAECLMDIETTNPCGEGPLLPCESCNLGSLNLARMLRAQAGSVAVDWEKLRITTRKAVRFLDNVVEVNKYPTPEIADISRGNRKLGLGVMDFAEALIRLGIPYDAAEAVGFAETLMAFISETAAQASQELAEERGTFANWRGSVHEAQDLRFRNATRTAIAPTGTIGIMTNTTPSVEPLFALAYRRVNVLDGQTLVEVNPILREWLENRGLEADALMEQIQKGSKLGEAQGVPEEARRLFITALEVGPEQHLQIQGAFQRQVDNSVSKTINFPHDATREDIARAYLRAHELGFKGVTVYRYGSKSSQVLELGAGERALHYDHASRCDPQECRV